MQSRACAWDYLTKGRREHDSLQIQLNSDYDNLRRTALLRTEYVCSLLSLFVGSSQYRKGHQYTPWYDRIPEAEVPRRRKIGIWAAESGANQVYYEITKRRDGPGPAENAIHFHLLVAGYDSVDLINEPLRPLWEDDTKVTYHCIDEKAKTEILHKDTQNLLKCVEGKRKIDHKLFSAVRWFGKAVNADVETEQFLFFAIAIECLLGGDEAKSPYASQGSITQKMAERAAFLASDCLQERMRTEHEIKALYGIRNKIVHVGSGANFADVIRMEKMARALIFRFAKMGFDSSESFLQWIVEKRYQ